MYSSKTKKSNIEEVIKVIYKEKKSDVGEKKKNPVCQVCKRSTLVEDLAQRLLKKFVLAKQF